MADPDAGPNQPVDPNAVPDAETLRNTTLIYQSTARREQSIAEFQATPEVTLPGGFKRRPGVRSFAG